MAQRKKTPGTETGLANSKENEAVVSLKQEIQKADRLYLDGKPYDLDRIDNEVSFFQDKAGESLLEIGKRFVLVKLHEDHGKFLAFLEKHNMGIRAAQFAMAAARKFSNADSNAAPNAKTFSHLGVSKMIALTVLDDEDVQTLAGGGEFAGMTLDDIERMGVRELKATIREGRKQLEIAEGKLKKLKGAKEKALEEKEAEIERLQNIIDYREPLTEKEKAEKAAAARLKPLLDELFGQLTGALAGLEGAMRAVVKAQAVEGATFPQLQEWARTHYHYLAPINNVYEELDQALNNCGPDRKESDYDGM